MAAGLVPTAIMSSFYNGNNGRRISNSGHWMIVGIVKRKLYKWIYALIFIASFLYIDGYGIVSLIGSLAMLKFLDFGRDVRGQANPQNSVNTPESSVRYKVLIWGSILGSFIIQVLFYSIKSESQLIIGGITLMQNPILLYYFIVPSVYFHKQKHRRTSIKNFLDLILICSCEFFRAMIIIMKSEISIDYMGGVVGVINELFQITIWAAVMEEIFFRGYLFDFAEKVYGYKKAMVLSSLLFMMFHVQLIAKCFEAVIPNVVNLIAIGMLGLLMNVLFDRYKSIIVCIVYHAITDGFILYVVLLFENYKKNL